MYLSEIELSIEDEDLNIDIDCDLTVKEAFLQGYYLDSEVELTKVEVIIYHKHTNTEVGTLELTKLINEERDYNHLKIKCENAIIDAYEEHIDCSEISEAESKYEFGKEN